VLAEPSIKVQEPWKVRIRFAKQKTVFPKFSLSFYFLNHLPYYREASRSIKWITCMVVPRTIGFLWCNVWQVTRNLYIVEILPHRIAVILFLVCEYVDFIQNNQLTCVSLLMF